MARGVKIKWTEQEEDYIRYICKGRQDWISYTSFLWIFKRDSNEICKAAFSSKRKRMGVPASGPGHFPKGNTPFNKGRKQLEYMSPESIERTKGTRFKKGLVPLNTRQVGSTRLDPDGFILVKTDNPKQGSKGWVHKHRLLYEQYHDVKLTSNDVVIFKDGDRTNFDIDNLMLITRQEHVIMNHFGFRHKDKVKTEIGVKIARLMIETNKMEKGKNK